MSIVGQPERHTQNRIVKVFRGQLHYDYLGKDNLNLPCIKYKLFCAIAGTIATLGKMLPFKS